MENAKIEDQAEPLKQDELINALNELLEAERAGARSTLETIPQVSSKDLANLVLEIQQDEVRWCKMLINSIHSLEHEPSRKTGQFYEKVMAISNLQERLIFINRGQSWVVKRLEKLIPKVIDQNIKKGLEQMLEAHKVNIKKVEDSLQ